MPTWDPALYRRFSADRDRPFHDLVAQVRAPDPDRVVDLGCGEGSQTATLALRWPNAEVVGVDSSAEMIATGRAQHPAVRFEHLDLRDWIASTPQQSQDVIVSNAALQWVPDHLALVPELLRRLRTGGWLAIQIPGNHGAPSHRALREVAGRPAFAGHTAEVRERPLLPGPGEYLDTLLEAGAAPAGIQVWETSYSHLLPGEDPVYEWISGTGARPILQALPEDLRAKFADQLRERLRQEYPSTEHGTVLEFRRVFAVAQRL